jgi:hypothetical protein
MRYPTLRRADQTGPPSRLQKLLRLRMEIGDGIHSIDGGRGGALDIEDFLRNRARDWAGV